MAIGTILAVGSTIGKVIGSRRRDDDINQAQLDQQNVEKKIRAEQGVRERTRQIRQAKVASSQAEANAVAQGGGSSGGANQQAGVASDLAYNLDMINFNTATGNVMSESKQNTMNAGRPSLFENINEAMSPLILGNVAGVNKVGSNIWDKFFGPPKAE